MLGGEIDLDSEVAKRSLLKGTVETIASLGLLSKHNGNASLSGLSLIRYHGIWLLPMRHHPRLYYILALIQLGSLVG